jgi:hypothetical protein
VSRPSQQQLWLLSPPDRNGDLDIDLRDRYDRRRRRVADANPRRLTPTRLWLAAVQSRARPPLVGVAIVMLVVAVANANVKRPAPPILNELERDHLIARVRNEHDRRRNMITLTPERLSASGRSGHAKAPRHAVQAAQDRLMAPLSASERRQLIRLLKRLVEHQTEGGH